jgi:uncharacterized protein (DUF2235 family)
MPKNIVLCYDGINNQFDGDHTNVIRTYKVARRNAGQITYYDPGVGTMPEPSHTTKLEKRLSMREGERERGDFTDVANFTTTTAANSCLTRSASVSLVRLDLFA